MDAYATPGEIHNLSSNWNVVEIHPVSFPATGEKLPDHNIIVLKDHRTIKAGEESSIDYRDSLHFITE